MPETFYYNAKTNRYHYASGDRKNEFIGAACVRELMRDYYDSRKADAREINRKLFDREISVGDWEVRQAELIKKVFIQAYKIGNPQLGSNRSTDPSDYGRIGNKLKDQYGYLRNFSGEILEGKLSESQINARVDQYLDAANWAYEEGRRLTHARGGWPWEKRVMSPMAEHCSSCPGYAALGWQKIKSLPAIGTQCECRSKDKCHFEYSKSITRPKDSFLKRNGWIA
jgi:hypothetical protein